MSGRVLVTRAAKQASRLSEALRQRGYEPVEVPLLEIAPPLSWESLDRALDEIESFDWLIVTSANAVQSVMARARELDLPVAPRKVAAVGTATAEAAYNLGWPVALIPEKYVAEALVEELIDQVAGQRILIARAAVARDVIPDALRAAGAEVTIAEAYRNRMPEGCAEQLRAALDEGIDAVTFTSSSSADHLFEAVKEAGEEWPLVGIPAISIGPITTQRLCDLGWEPEVEASPYNIPGLVEAVSQVLG